MPSSRVKTFNGSRWQPEYGVKKYNGSSWGDAQAFRYDGDSWEPMIDRVPDKKQYTSSWASTWVGGYNGAGYRIRTDAGYQGRYDETHENQNAMFGFNIADIRSKLAGSVINYTEIAFKVRHTYWHAGAIFAFGSHNYAGSSSPTRFGPVISRGLKTSAQIPPGSYSHFTMPNSFGVQLRDRVSCGLTLDVSSNDRLYYGAITNITITITYTK